MSPISVSKLQFYLKDTSTDSDLLGFYQILIDTATDVVYTFLDRDYAALANKEETFWGDDTNIRTLHAAAGEILSWIFVDLEGNIFDGPKADLLLFEGGRTIVSKSLPFQKGFEHRISYSLPTGLMCPAAVAQVIIEHAAIMFNESNQGQGTLGDLMASSRNSLVSDRVRYIDLTEGHKDILRLYKRYPV